MSGSELGPRGGEQLDVDDFDDHRNLVLLCGEHHKMVDDHPDLYPAEDLRRLKAEHEHWVRHALGPVDVAGATVFELPMVPRRLVNREAELAALSEASNRSLTEVLPTVVVLRGMHGVGKSALAAHWLMRNSSRFDGGTFVADLSRRRNGEVDIASVLGRFLHQLGGTAEALPATLSERRRLFRQITARRRTGILLDDVAYAAQVQACLPAGPAAW